MKGTKKKQEYFDICNILDGLKDSCWIRLDGDLDIQGLNDGDLLLVDRGLTKPRTGEIVVWGTDFNDLTIDVYDDQRKYVPPVYGTVVSMLRKFARKRPPQKKTKPTIESPEIAKLRRELARLERLPENEATRFQIESEIYKLEHQSDNEWPEVIGGAA